MPVNTERYRWGTMAQAAADRQDVNPARDKLRGMSVTQSMQRDWQANARHHRRELPAEAVGMARVAVPIRKNQRFGWDLSEPKG